MNPIHLPSEEEVRRAARQGEEAVVPLVNNLIQVIVDLVDRVHTLEDRLAKDSHNSNQPPSSDGLQKKPKSLRHKSGKKSGGQTGHAGHRLESVMTPNFV
jgi:transposase